MSDYQPGPRKAKPPMSERTVPAPGLPPRPSLFGLPNGRQHWRRDGSAHAWCGVKEQFRHRPKKGDVADVTCPDCLTAIKRGRPRAWKS